MIVGLSNGNIQENTLLGSTLETYGIHYDDEFLFRFCFIGGKKHPVEWPDGVIVPWDDQGGVIGCGLLLNPKNELSIFFTINGILMGQFIYDS
jgi:hypothetical protein